MRALVQPIKKADASNGAATIANVRSEVMAPDDTAASAGKVRSPRMRRILWLGVLALLAPLPPRAARAAEARPVDKQITIDVDVVSVGLTFAHRLGQGRVLLGGGGGLGVSPYLGATFATGDHYDPRLSYTPVLELAHAQFFTRFELASWLRADTGVRVGLFVHGNEDLGGGLSYQVFVAPALVWRWLSLGPRISAGVLTESGGPTEGVLVIDYAMLRFVIGW